MNGSTPKTERRESDDQVIAGQQPAEPERDAPIDNVMARPKWSINLRTGTMYGAAIGMLVGLTWQALDPIESIASIVRWRNAILAGAALGFLITLIWQSTRKP